MNCAREYMVFIILGILGLQTSSEPTFELDHRQHLPEFEQIRHPLKPHQESWKEANEYIKRSFKDYSLNLQVQTFQTEIANHENALVKVKGENLIGESWSPDPNAPVIVIGAYYDSPLHSIPLRQSGGSMASLLETARNFQKMKIDKKIHQNVSVLFVAFDLNVQHYVPSGPGVPGAAFFVKEWLSEVVKEKKFIGAILLDSVTSVNTDKNSQRLTPGFDQVFPDAYDSIVASGLRGDFVGALSRNDKANRNFTLTYSETYERIASDSDSPFHMEELLLADGVRPNPSLKNFLRKSSVIKFWTHSPPLPAMILTDLGQTRTDFDADDCSQECPLKTFWSETRKEFVEAITLTSLRMLLSYQEMNNDSPATTTESGPEMPDVPKPTIPENKSSALSMSCYLAVASCAIYYYFSVGLY